MPFQLRGCRIARDDMEMDVRVDHHQHQIIDPLVAREGGQRALDQPDGDTPVRRRLRAAAPNRPSHRSSPRGPASPASPAPGGAARANARIRGPASPDSRTSRSSGSSRRSPCLRSRSRNPKWPARAREPLPRRSVAIVAQLVRALVCGTRGRGFKSPRSPHSSSATTRTTFSDTMTTPWGLARLRRARRDPLRHRREVRPASAIIAVHSTHLGPAAGGARFWHYAEGRGGADRRAAAVARHELQECHGRAFRSAAARR